MLEWNDHSFNKSIILLLSSTHRYVYSCTQPHKTWKMILNFRRNLQFPIGVKPEKKKKKEKVWWTEPLLQALLHSKQHAGSQQPAGNYCVFETSCLWNQALHLLLCSQPPLTVNKYVHQIFRSNTMGEYHAAMFWTNIFSKDWTLLQQRSLKSRVVSVQSHQSPHCSDQHIPQMLHSKFHSTIYSCN